MCTRILWRSIPVLLLLSIACLPLPAAPIRSEQIPPELKEWREWVLYGEEEKTCPFLFSRLEEHRCAWPTELRLDLNKQGGQFSQSWQAYTESWLSLPGDLQSWPLDVQLDGKAAVVVQRGNRPQVRVPAGRHTVSGVFRWNGLPETLPVPRETGLIDLRVDGSAVSVPELDDNGRLWLARRGTAAQAEAGPGNALRLRVFRRIVDETPLQVFTRVELEISGAQREESIGGALLEQFIPLSLASRLPARLESDGKLRVQVRPGRWVLDLAARHPAPVGVMPLPVFPDPWPKEEVWVFDARNHLRLVEIAGPATVDPRQTGLPEDWQNLPAYLMNPGQEFRFTVIRRGDPEPEPDQLSLHRNLWLDFEGTGYTIQDTISGRMTRGWRLEVNAPTQLGRVSLDGDPQFITTLAGSDRQGVEVRRGQLSLSADSRFEDGIADLPAVGWNHDFQGVSATLHLPPGWDLLSASGIDDVPDTWIKRWTLLDIFLVLIAALAVRGLWHWKPALFALAVFVLIWHEPGAPRYVWLNILAAIAMLRVLPLGRFQTVVRWYRNLAWLALIIISVPFMVDQVRNGLYPQLEMGPYYPMPTVAREDFAAPAQLSGQMAPAAAPPEAEVLADSAADQVFEKSAALAGGAKRAMERTEEAVASTRRKISNFNLIDPDANVQTGPGLPTWQWKQIPLGWNGPVQKEQQISLLLLSPAANLVLNFARVLLIAALALLMFGFRFTPGRGLHHAAAALMACALLPALAIHVPEARAETPTPELLQELKSRLLAPPECLPACAQSPRLRVELGPQSLSVRVEIHASEAIAAPLPAQGGLWVPEEVLLDGGPAGALMRSGDGTLLIQLGPGAHQVILRGKPPAGVTFQLPLPLPPRHVEYSAEGWSVEGVADNRPVGGQLQFTRQVTEREATALAELQPAELPPFVRIERTLNLGLEWSVGTQVTRLSPRGSPIVVAVPLLAGESVTTDEVKVENGKVLVNIAGNGHSFQWESSLSKSETISMTAPDSTAWVESWKADVSPVWHVETSGIAVVHHQDEAGHWLPEWRPWPGESVQLAVTRPEGVPGRTLTIDQVLLSTTPGKRATDTTVSLSLRSSRGGQHTLGLPPEVELQSVNIDGVAQPIRQENAKVTLPVHPGAQSVDLAFRSSVGIETVFSTPALDLGAPAVNARLHVSLGQDRWAMLVGGPRLGPAVLFWGVLLVVALIAVGLGRVGLTPLTTWHWFLLGVGLTQTSIGEAVIIVGWLLALGGRTKLGSHDSRGWFNFVQIVLGFLTLLALTTLFGAVRHGLLGTPEMQITGNGSTAWDLNWYQDRSVAALPQAWILSVPLWAYRGLMLAWALWLAFALLRWLRWGWNCFSAGGLWKPKPKIEKNAA